MKVGFIGLGNVGGKLAESVDLIITCLPSPVASAMVMEAEDGILAGISDRATEG